MEPPLGGGCLLTVLVAQEKLPGAQLHEGHTGQHESACGASRVGQVQDWQGISQP